MSSSNDVSSAVVADRLILGCLAASGLLALAIGHAYDTMATAVAGASCLAVVGVAAWLLAPGTTASSVMLSSALMASVALQIDLARGVTELHFGVFVTLALVLVYRDGRPLLAAAALVAVHHVVFDRLQAAGVGVYCTAQPDVLRILAHAGYVVVQTGVELLIVHHMRRAARQGEEMAALVAHLSRDDQVSLDVHGIATRTPLGDELKRALVRLNDSLRAVREGVMDIERAAGDVAEGNRDLSQRTERMASHLQQTAASTEQLAGHVQQSALSAVDANALVVRTAEAAARGGEAMASVVSNMGRIAEASQRIGDVIGVVDTIAFQTNILALNAAVEAARAGEQGRGFAVVAGEVRVLARRSAEAAREIKGLIGRSTETVDAGARQVHEAGATIDGIVAGVQTVSEIMRRISTASSEQSGDIVQINAAVSGLDQDTQQNAALVERSAAAAASLRKQAQRLAQSVGQFRLAEA